MRPEPRLATAAAGGGRAATRDDSRPATWELLKMWSLTLLFPVALQLTTILAAHGVRGAPLSSDYSGCDTHGGIYLPSWEPTWDMYRSTLLYTCNNSRMHDVNDAV
eukprot:COSAG05_NODE_8959_length_658_cov_1.084079_1_plen_105_part_10